MASKQDTYRRLMKQQKSQSGGVHRINSPLAKYNSLGQLSCIVCSLAIKSELLWQTHLQSKRHKESIAALKAKKNQVKPHSGSVKNVEKDEPFSKRSQTHAGKRSRTESSSNLVTTEESENKKSRVTSDSNVDKSLTAADTSNTANPSSSQLPADFFDPNLSKEAEDAVDDNDRVDTVASKNGVSNLPADFFDQPHAQEKEEGNKETSGKEKKGDLPEGFFDNPKVDAKVRKVEYKDPQEQMWEEFQKTIQKETQVSEAIVEEEDEEMKEDRELVEVNEQVACFERAERLREKQEMLAVQTVKNPELVVGTGGARDIVVKQEEDQLLDDVDFDDLLNWRSKMSL